MTDKAYIVANKEQELDVLNKLEQNGMLWDEGEKPTEWIASERGVLVVFPYVISYRDDGKIVWFNISKLKDETIVYDGRKEEKMYKVTQGFMNELIKWRDEVNLDAKSGSIDTFVNGYDIEYIPNVLQTWWTEPDNPIENNNRLIAIIQWLNGEEVFEVEAPHKFFVRNDTPDGYGDYYYVQRYDGVTYTSLTLDAATAFDTREEAQEWANSHQVVVEINEEENEVE